MELKDKNIFKLILYAGLLFLFLALAVFFGAEANRFNNLSKLGETETNWVKSVCAAFVFFDIFAVLLSMYWISKILVFLLELKAVDMDINLENLFELVLYSGLFSLYLALAVTFGIFANNAQYLFVNHQQSYTNSIFAAFILADIFAILLAIYQIIRILPLVHADSIFGAVMSKSRNANIH